MWHNSAALGYFPGWYWPSQGIPTELSTSPSEGGINYWCLQISAKFEVQQGIISRNVSRFLHVSESSAFSLYILLFCLLYLYPKSMDYCHGFGCVCLQFLCTLKVTSVTHRIFNRSLIHHVFLCASAPLIHHISGSSKMVAAFGQTMRPVCTQSCQRTVATFSSSIFFCRCYCILHEDNVLGAIFGLWKELRAATSWEDVENLVWGELNRYQESWTL